MNRGVEVWAASLLLTLIGAVVTLGVWWVAVLFGAPALMAWAIGLGVAVSVGALIGGVMWWLAD